MTQIHQVVSVEDDFGIYNIIAASLKKLPIELHHAETGSKGISLINQCQANLVILDISLPDMNGWDVLQNLSQSLIDKPKIIVLTAFSDPAHRLIGHLHDVTYMSKPFMPNELAGKASELLEIQN